ncbi:MAG: YeeE/YedE family protein [Nitrospirae bacterium]|nr:YeeE/YedE family protein [Nitrospirota bacterium]
MARWAAGRWIVTGGVIGLLAGAFAYDLFFPSMFAWGLFAPPQSATLPIVLNVSFAAVALPLGVLILLMMALADRLDPARGRAAAGEGSEPVLYDRIFRKEWGWISGSVLFAGLVVLATAQGEYLGIAGGIPSFLAHVTAPLGYKFQTVGGLSDHTAWRAALIVGLVPGALIAARLARVSATAAVAPMWSEVIGTSTAKRVAVTTGAGFLLSFGAMVGGGCTSGAFVAGWPTLSVGNFAMGMTFFMTAMATAFLVYGRKRARFHEIRAARNISLADD